MMKSKLKVIILAFATIGMFSANAQDGEKLFKTHCAACHTVNSKLIGPPLEGITAKWEEAGELEFLYQWVQNSPELIASGKSKLATAIQEDQSIAIPMAPVGVTDEEVAAIFEYVDNWVAPVEDEAVVLPPGGKIPLFETTEVEGLSDETNNAIFHIQLILLVFLIAIAIFFSMTIKKLALFGVENGRSNSGNNNLKTLITLFATALATTVPTLGYSLSIDMSGDRLFNATLSDNMVLMVINLVLLVLVVYLRSVIKSITHSLHPEYYENLAKAKTAAADGEGSLIAKLTDQVPIEEEASILLDHEYDGIQELNNHLPPWWLWSFYATIAFALYYHVTHDILVTTPDQYAIYDMEVAEAEAEIAEYLALYGPSYDETTVTLATEPSELEAGKAVFQDKCVACHLADGQGSVGPNLTDEYWMYGNDVKDIFALVKYGNKNGMPEHDSKLKADEIRNVSSYVLSLPYVKGKDPEGEKK